MSAKSVFDRELIPAKAMLNIACTLDEVNRARELNERRLFLYGAILSVDEDELACSGVSSVSKLVEVIMDYNRFDQELEPDKREPVILYISSPGGDVTEGFSLISAIEVSKTPIYTVNVGEWSSMSFLIGISGDRRYSLPYSTFLLHDGSTFAGGTASKVQDRVDFEKRFEKEVIKKHVLKHSSMTSGEYDSLARVELYMLPEDAKKRGFIDEIVDDIDAIL